MALKGLLKYQVATTTVYAAIVTAIRLGDENDILSNTPEFIKVYISAYEVILNSAKNK